MPSNWDAGIFPASRPMDLLASVDDIPHIPLRPGDRGTGGEYRSAN